MAVRSFGFAGLRLAGQELEEGLPRGVAHRGVLDAVLAAVDDDQVPAKPPTLPVCLDSPREQSRPHP